MEKVNAFFMVGHNGTHTPLMSRDIFNTEEYIGLNKQYHGNVDNFVEEIKKKEHLRKDSETLYFENIGIAEFVHSNLPIAPTNN